MDRVRLFKFNNKYYNFTDAKSRAAYLKAENESEEFIEWELIRKLKYNGVLYDTQSVEFKFILEKIISIK